MRVDDVGANATQRHGHTRRIESGDPQHERQRHGGAQQVQSESVARLDGVGPAVAAHGQHMQLDVGTTREFAGEGGHHRFDAADHTGGCGRRKGAGQDHAQTARGGGYR